MVRRCWASIIDDENLNDENKGIYQYICRFQSVIPSIMDANTPTPPEPKDTYAPQVDETYNLDFQELLQFTHVSIATYVDDTYELDIVDFAKYHAIQVDTSYELDIEEPDTPDISVPFISNIFILDFTDQYEPLPEPIEGNYIGIAKEYEVHDY